MNTKQDLKTLMKGWTQYGDLSLAATCPANEGVLETFTVGKYITAKELDEEYTKRGLVPATPYQIAEYVLRDPDFKEKYLATQWESEGTCFAAFSRWVGARGVDVRRHDGGWRDSWWFGAVRVSPQPSDSSSLHLDAQNLELPFNFPKKILIEGEEYLLKSRLANYEENEKGCWNWTGTLSKGYGVMKVHSRSTRVHRLMYEVFVGPIPEGLVIDHLCKNKQCVNPEHLEAVTSRENTLRGDGPTAINARKSKTT